METDQNSEADDKEFDLQDNHVHQKNVKEKSEIIFEVKTICNVEQVKPNYELYDQIFDIPNKMDQLNQGELSNQSSTIQDISNHVYNISSKSKIVNKNNENKCVVHTESTHESFPSIETKPDQSPAFPLFKIEKMEDSLSYESSEEQGDIKRTSRRKSTKRKEFDECCPICGVTVRLQDLESHCNQEIEKLSKLQRPLKKHLEIEGSKNEMYLEVKRNRESRLTACVARYSARAKNEVKCPMCSLRMTGTDEEINKHVALCIQDQDTDVDVESLNGDDAESYEEYEIGDETRIRAISLVPGGYRSLQGASSVMQSTEEDLNVDVDDTITYGEPQYSEMDVIPDVMTEKDKVDFVKLRQAVVKDTNIQPIILESRKWSKIEKSTEENSGNSDITTKDLVVSSLKERLKELEDPNNSVKCQVCLEPFTKPLVSTTCWHVHCEECWLMTMGVKKLCPQCNMIVFPSDLRKIYL